MEKARINREVNQIFLTPEEENAVLGFIYELKNKKITFIEGSALYLQMLERRNSIEGELKNSISSLNESYAHINGIKS